MAQKERIDIIVSAKNVTQKAFNNISNSLGKLKENIFSVKTAFIGLTTAIGGGAVARDFINTAASFEQMAVSLDTVTGNAQEAMSWIKDFSVQTPYMLEDVAEAYRKLAAYGINPEEFLESIGDTASAMGKTLDQAVEAFADAATGEFERLKEFGVRAKVEGDNVTFAWMQNGQLMEATTSKNAESITNTLKDVFARFSGSMEQQAETFNGKWSNLVGQWQLFKQKIAESGLFDYIKEQLQDVLDIVQELADNGTLETWAKSISDWLVEVFKSAEGQLESIYNKVQELKPTFENILSATKDFFSSVESGWNALPSWVREIGVITAIVGGKKGVVALLGILHTIDALRNSWAGLMAVIKGQMSFSDYATSNYDELKEKLSEIGVIENANGNVLKGGFQAFATGGIVKRPTLGLVGEGKYNEAIVPLPDGRSIPVEMRGGQNVTININAIDAKSFEEYVKRNGSAIVDVVFENMKYGGKLKYAWGR